MHAIKIACFVFKKEEERRRKVSSKCHYNVF